MIRLCHWKEKPRLGRQRLATRALGQYCSLGAGLRRGHMGEGARAPVMWLGFRFWSRSLRHLNVGGLSLKKYLGAKLKGFFRKDEACEHYLLNWARQIYDRKDILGLQDLIKLVMRPLQSRHMVDAYLKMPHRAMEELWWLNSLGFIGRMPGRDMEINYFIMQSAVSVPPDLVLDLSSDTVLPTPWHPSSIVNMIGRIGPGRPLGKFKQSTNHRVTFMSPINLGWVDGGNHSITQPIVSVEGQRSYCRLG